MDSQHDNRQFVEHFLANQARIYSFVRHLIPNGADAEEVFQRVALTLWERWDAFDPSKSQDDQGFCRWAIGIARNHVRNFIRQESRNRGSRLFGSEAMDKIADAWWEMDTVWEDRQDAMLRCMDKLDANSRRFLGDFYEGSVSPQSLADRQGTTVRTVYRKIEKLRRVLLACINQRLNAHGS